MLVKALVSSPDGAPKRVATEDCIGFEVAQGREGGCGEGARPLGRAGTVSEVVSAVETTPSGGRKTPFSS